MMVITMMITITTLVITDLRKLTEEATQMKSTEEMTTTPTVAEPTRLTIVLTDPTGEITILIYNRITLGEAILHQAMEETVVVPLLEMVVLEEDQTGKI